jgi:nitroreductase
MAVDCLDALEAIRSRRSIRKYTDEPVSDEALEAIVDAALRAPTANAKRPWWIVVARDAQKRDQLSQVSGYAGFCAQSPVVLAVCGDDSSEWWIDDCAALTENALVAAAALGLGTCWVGIHDADYKGRDREEYVRGVLNIPAEVRVLGLIALGHPAEAKSPHDPDTVWGDYVRYEAFT